MWDRQWSMSDWVLIQWLMCHHTRIDQSNASNIICIIAITHFSFVNAVLNGQRGHSFFFYQTQDEYNFFVFFVCSHRFSVASYMLLHVQDFRGHRNTDLAYRAGLCIMQWKYLILNGRCWMTSALNCIYFWQTLSCQIKLQEGMICFYRAKEDLCASLRWTEPD